MRALPKLGLHLSLTLCALISVMLSSSGLTLHIPHSATLVNALHSVNVHADRAPCMFTGMNMHTQNTKGSFSKILFLMYLCAVLGYPACNKYHSFYFDWLFHYLLGSEGRRHCTCSQAAEGMQQTGSQSYINPNAWTIQVPSPCQAVGFQLAPPH